MADIKGLALDCRRLWAAKEAPDPNDGTWDLWILVDNALSSASIGIPDYGQMVGPIQHAVGVECVKHGWFPEWSLHPTYGWTFYAMEWDEGLKIGGDIQDFDGVTFLECALVALKWFLENPMEDTDGKRLDG
jgi:hypothetical protein